MCRGMSRTVEDCRGLVSRNVEECRGMSRNHKKSIFLVFVFLNDFVVISVSRWPNGFLRLDFLCKVGAGVAMSAQDRLCRSFGSVLLLQLLQCSVKICVWIPLPF